MDSEDGEYFIKQLASFIRTHEKALANALQLRRQSISASPSFGHGTSQSISGLPTPRSPISPKLPERPSTSSAISNPLTAAFSLSSLNLTSQNVKPAKLALTPHHLFYLLSRFEEMGIAVGPMKVRLENLHDTSTSANYVSFLSSSQRTQSRGSDVVSTRSASSVRSVMSGMSALWSGFGSSISASRVEKQKAQAVADLKYLYSSFTKIPYLQLAPDWRARLIRGFEEFPFDSAVPLYVFKNLQVLEVSGIDFRQFFGWDRIADQIRSLTLKRASIDDPGDILIDIVLDDIDQRRRRTSKGQPSPTATPHTQSSSPRRSPSMSQSEFQRFPATSMSPGARASTGDLQAGSVELGRAGGSRRSSVATVITEPRSPTKHGGRPRSHSPTRPTGSRHQSHPPRGPYKMKRSGSGSSHSSVSDSLHGQNPRNSASNLLAMGILPPSKWRFLKHLSLADNALTTIAASSLAPLADTLQSLDLSTNLFTQIPDSLASLTALRALNLSHCMIDSLHSLTRNPLPAISALNLRSNRLQSLAGIEKLYPLERLDLRENRLHEPLELARLTGIPDMRECWVEGNPFTHTHRDYRITIFNLFRRTPGHSEDVVIDASGPSFSEKRYLVERVAIPAAVPVMKPAVAETPAVDVSKSGVVYDITKEAPALLRKERRPAKAVMSEADTNSTRKRRMPVKRRIVDLAQPTPTPTPTLAPSKAADTGGNHQLSDVAANQAKAQSLSNEAISLGSMKSPAATIPRLDNSKPSPQLPRTLPTPEAVTAWKESPDWNVSGELYRQKIESLRDKVGNGYLSVLNEESWDQPTRASPFVDFGPASTVHGKPAGARAASAQPVHSGRTLG